MAKKQTKQSRKTKARKDRQAIEWQRAQPIKEYGRPAIQWDAAHVAAAVGAALAYRSPMMGPTSLRAPRTVYIDDSGPVKSNIWNIR